MTKTGRSLIVAAILIMGFILYGCGGGGQTAGGTGQAPLVRVEISPENPTIARETSISLTATAIYADNTKADITGSAEWSVSDSNIATVQPTNIYPAGVAKVSSSGKAYANGKNCGHANIKASSGTISGVTTLTVSCVSLVSVVITPANSRISKGTRQQLIAVGTFSDNSTQDITTSSSWSSSDASVATITSGGLATSTGTGTTTIKVNASGISAETILTVTPATLASIVVTPSNPTIGAGTSVKLTATGVYSDNTTQDISSQVSWTSPNTSVATVAPDGTVTGIASGTSIISANLNGKSGTANLTVTQVKLTSISVTPTNPSIASGMSAHFSATAMYSDNSTQDLTASVIWTSSNMTVANISNTSGASGTATGISAGTTTITAALGSMTGTTALTVTPAVLTAVSVSPVNSSNAKGTTRQFTALGSYSDSTVQDLTAKVTWTSNNTSVVSISNASGSNGLATGLASGTATITATVNSMAASTTMTVTPSTLSTLTISPSNPTNVKGTTRQFAATGTYSDGTSQNLTASVSWVSSNTAVATISNTSGSNGLASCTGTGTATITATFSGISISTTLTVTQATLTSITISPTNPSVNKGSTIQMIARGTYSDGSTQTITPTVTWGTSNSTIATISNSLGSNGLAAGVVAGTVTISAVSGSVSASTVLTVNSTGSLILSWKAPTTNTDGSSLTNLGGYKVFWGTSSGVYTTTLDVGNVLQYALNNFAGGYTYYFAVKAYNASSVESSYSNEASTAF
jgi:uncharacterized protein YjdB